MSTVKIKINSVPRHSGTLVLELDEDGTVKDRFWRRRLKDAEIDNCVEIVKPKRKVKETSE